MRLVLTLSGNGVPEKDKVRTLSTGSITIGRAAGNDWVLPDPDRSLSKTHCSIMERNGRFILVDTSTNGIFLNGAAQATERDSQTVLNQGDKLILGDYSIVVSADDDIGMGYQPVMPTGNEYPNLGGPLMPRGPLDMDALDDPLGRPGAPGGASGGYSSQPGFSHPMAPVDVQARRSLDPFDQAQQGRSSGFAGGIGPDDDMFRGVQQSNDWQGASRPDHTPVISTAMPTMRVTSPPMGGGGDIDFDALIGDLPGANPNRGAPPPAARGADPFAAPQGGQMGGAMGADPFGAPPQPMPGQPGGFPPGMPGAGFGGPPPGFNAADLMADLAMPGQPDPFGAPPNQPAAPQPPVNAAPVSPRPVSPPAVSPFGGMPNPAAPHPGMPDPAMLNPGLPGAAVPPPMPTPMPPGMIPQDINPPGHVPGGLQPGVPVTDPFAAPNVSHPGAGFPIAPEPQQPGAGFPGGYPAVSPSGGLDAAIPPMAEAVPPPFAPPAATPFAPPAATPFAPPAAATPLGASNPFEEAAGRHVADDAAFDPLAVTTRQAPVSADAAAPMPPSVAGGAPPAAMPSSPATAPAPATGGADARAAFRAFLEGAGMADGQVDDADPEASLRLAGAVFKAMTEGLREILISRAAIKSEMRIEATMISAQGNNPLKFSVAPEDAVAAMLTQKRRGYMAPVAAAREAVADIKDHEIAVMAGVQTALMHLLKRFNPDELEKRLSLGGLSAVLPGARKSRYWDSFRQIYGDITREAEDDFQAVFGRNFAKAYTEQSRKD